MSWKDAAITAASWLGVEVRRPPRPLLAEPSAALTVTLDHLIGLRMMTDDPDLFVLQIGAFDGKTGDQIHEYLVRYKWRGLLVEPQLRHFQRLRETYADHPQLRLMNVAVSTNAGTRTLWSVCETVENPDWAGQVSTFDRSRLEDAGFQIEGHEVECVPLTDLLAEVERVDLLQVDTEGFDAEIIRMFDFDTYLPNIVRFENVCLSRADHEASIARLIDYGYRVAPGHTDTIAWHD